MSQPMSSIIRHGDTSGSSSNSNNSRHNSSNSLHRHRRLRRHSNNSSNSSGNGSDNGSDSTNSRPPLPPPSPVATLHHLPTGTSPLFGPWASWGLPPASWRSTAAVVAATMAAMKRLMRLDYVRTIGDARTMTATPRHWFRGTSVPSCPPSWRPSSSSARQATRARSARCRPPTRLAKAGAS